MPFWYILPIKNFREKDFDIFENYLDKSAGLACFGTVYLDVISFNNSMHP